MTLYRPILSGRTHQGIYIKIIKVTGKLQVQESSCCNGFHPGACVRSDGHTFHPFRLFGSRQELRCRIKGLLASACFGDGLCVCVWLAGGLTIPLKPSVESLSPKGRPCWPVEVEIYRPGVDVEERVIGSRFVTQCRSGGKKQVCTFLNIGW